MKMPQKWPDKTKKGWEAFLGEKTVTMEGWLQSDFYLEARSKHGANLVAFAIEITLGNNGGVGWIHGANRMQHEGKEYVYIDSENTWDLKSIDDYSRDFIKTAIEIEKKPFFG